MYIKRHDFQVVDADLLIKRTEANAEGYYLLVNTTKPMDRMFIRDEQTGKLVFRVPVEAILRTTVYALAEVDRLKAELAKLTPE